MGFRRGLGAPNKQAEKINRAEICSLLGLRALFRRNKNLFGLMTSLVRCQSVFRMGFYAFSSAGSSIYYQSTYKDEK